MFTKHKQKKRANIAISTVLLISTILMVIAAGLIVTSLNLINSNKSNSNYEIAKGRAQECIEESLKKLKADNTFNGPIDYSYPDGSQCRSTVSTPGSDNSVKTLQVAASYNGYNYEVQRTVSVLGASAQSSPATWTQVYGAINTTANNIDDKNSAYNLAYNSSNVSKGASSSGNYYTLLSLNSTTGFIDYKITSSSMSSLTVNTNVVNVLDANSRVATIEYSLDNGSTFTKSATQSFGATGNTGLASQITGTMNFSKSMGGTVIVRLKIIGTVSGANEKVGWNYISIVPTTNTYDFIPRTGDLTANSLTTSALDVMSNTNSLASKVDYSTGTMPYSIASADFNGDGRPDLVTPNNSSTTVSVLMNNGNGTFATKVDYTTASSPSSVATGDFNGDGKPDFVVGNQNGTVSVFLNNGDGTFAAKVDYTTGNWPNSIAVGDVNNDGKLDLVTANVGSGASVSVLLGNGDGTFAAKVDYTGNSGNGTITLADINKDGYLDILVNSNSSTPTFSTFLNNRDGTFAAKVDFNMGYQAYALSVADLNSDGYPDIIATNRSNNTLVVYTNTGTSPYFNSINVNTYNASTGPSNPLLVDMNNDGKLDMVVPNQTTQTISLFINNGDGTFGPKVDYAGNNYPGNLVSGDFNGDGKIDIAANNLFTNNVSVFINNGSPIKLLSTANGYLNMYGGYNFSPKNASIVSNTTSSIRILLGIYGDYAYGISSSDGTKVLIYNISNPQSPVLMNGSGFSLPYTYYNSYQYKIVGKFLYLMTYNGSSAVLTILDLSNPVSPTTLSNTAIGTTYALDISGKYIFIGYNNGTSTSILTYDISNPTSPVQVASTSLGFYMYRFVIQGNLIIGQRSNENTIAIINIANPLSPVVLSSSSSIGFVGTANRGIFVKGRYAYIGDYDGNGDGQIRIVDISNPASPSLVSSYDTGRSSTPDTIYVVGNYLYVQNLYTEKFIVLDISNASAPQLVQSLTVTTGFGAGIIDLYVRGRYGYLGIFNSATSYYSFVVLDLMGSYINGFDAGSINTSDLNIQNGFTALSGNFKGSLSIAQNLFVNGNSGFNGNTSFIGNVGIGTISPGTKFSIAPATSYGNPSPGTASGAFSILGDTGLYGLYSGLYSSGTAWLQVMRNDSTTTSYPLVINPAGGKLGVGISTAASSVPSTLSVSGVSNSVGLQGTAISPNFSVRSTDLANSVGAEVNVASFGTASGNWESIGLSIYRNTADGAYTGTAGCINYNVDNTVRIGSGNLCINASGYVGLGGITNPSYRLQLPNTASAAGQGQANAWVTYSSQQWKENVNEIQNAMDYIMRMRGVFFDWKKEQGGTHDIGFIAEEVAKVVPELASYDANGKVNGLKYDRITSVLVEAMKEQQNQINSMSVAISNINNNVSYLTLDKNSNTLTTAYNISTTKGINAKSLNADSITVLDINSKCTDSSNNILSDQTGCSVYAQRYDASEITSDGDIVEVNTGISNKVQKTSTKQSKLMLGIVSEKAALVTGLNDGSQLGGNTLNKITSSSTIVGIAGKTLVKVNLENGDIKAGDPITSSSTSGIGMKANTGDPIIGIALEDYNQSNINFGIYKKINILIKNTNN